MAKVKSPLLSIGGSGQIGKSIVFGNWRGVPYARQLVTPSNPNSTEQQTTRNTFSALSALWKILPSAARAPFDAATTGRPLTNRNQYIKSNNGPLRGQADMSAYVGSPGALGGISPTSNTPADGAGAGDVDVAVGTPSEPTGWTLSKVVGTAFKDRDPAVTPDDFPVLVEDSSPTAGSDSTLAFSGLESASDYVFTVWTEWTRPDGRTAYGPSIATIYTAP